MRITLHPSAKGLNGRIGNFIYKTLPDGQVIAWSYTPPERRGERDPEEIARLARRAGRDWDLLSPEQRHGWCAYYERFVAPLEEELTADTLVQAMVDDGEDDVQEVQTYDAGVLSDSNADNDDGSGAGSAQAGGRRAYVRSSVLRRLLKKEPVAQAPAEAAPSPLHSISVRPHQNKTCFEFKVRHGIKQDLDGLVVLVCISPATDAGASTQAGAGTAAASALAAAARTFTYANTNTSAGEGKGEAPGALRGRVRLIRGISPNSALALPRTGGTIVFNHARFGVEPGQHFAVEARIVRLSDGAASPALFCKLRRPHLQ